MSPPIISVEHLSKAYRIGQKEDVPDTFVGALSGWCKAPLRNWKRLRSLNTFDVPQDETDVALAEQNGNGHVSKPQTPDDVLWALRDVSFEVHEGEVVGIIGRNGAGKSTLLKILSRITEPTHGRAVIRGRVSSLLEVGTGFHPELTGRENIYMNGTILGMRKKEIDRKFDEIVDFSGVEKFLDTPIKRYSSGMQVRLAFAVAAHLEPEILIIDEVLAVGDAEFQKKCLGKMQDVAKGGRTVLFVSHNMAAVESLCSRAIILDSGRVTKDGQPFSLIGSYYSLYRPTTNRLESYRQFQDTGILRRPMLLNESGEPTASLPIGGCLHLQFLVFPQRQLRYPSFGVGIDGGFGHRALSILTPLTTATPSAIDLPTCVDCVVDPLPLPPGDYRVRISVHAGAHEIEAAEDAFLFTVVDADVFGEGRGFHRGTCVAPSKWNFQPQFGIVKSPS